MVWLAIGKNLLRLRHRPPVLVAHNRLAVDHARPGEQIASLSTINGKRLVKSLPGRL
jgi:hypothetical protein